MKPLLSSRSMGLSCDFHRVLEFELGIGFELGLGLGFTFGSGGIFVSIP